MSVVRAFVAAEIPPAIQRALGQISADLQSEMKGLPLRWVPVENIHLTLKFLGETSEENITPIIGIMGKLTQKVTSMEVSLNGFGVFPNRHRPNVIWVGLEIPETLFDLQRRLEAETSRLGYQPEARVFSPHLTLARVRREAHPGDLKRVADLMATRPKVGAAGRIDFITLFRSELRPGGAVYNALFRSPLAETV